MFNIGGGEVLVIALVALIVLGPQRLPDAARQAGKAIGELRRLSSGFQNEIKSALDVAQVASEQPTSPRTPLTASPDASPKVADAIAAVSDQPPARRTPLKAAPVKPVKKSAKAASPAKAARKSPTASPKAGRLRSNGP